MTPTMETLSGRFVDLANPEPNQIRIIDIARSLSRQARYNGHTRGNAAYSVAQHSVWVAAAAQTFWGADNIVALQALLHDAHEAYMGDVCSPMKAVPGLYGPLKALEGRLQRAIHVALDIPDPCDGAADIVRQADLAALAVEALHLMPSRGAGWPGLPDVGADMLASFRAPLSPQLAFEQFWMAWEHLRHGLPLEALCA